MAFGESLKNFFVGTPGQQLQFNRFTPQQQGLQNQSIQQILSLLQGGGQGGQQGQGAVGQFNFEPIAQQARTRFQTQTLPLLAERFSSLGSNKASSGLPGQAFQEAQGLEEGLAALQSKYNLAAGGQQNQQRNQLLSLLLSLAMQPSFETGYRPGTSGLLGGLAGGVGQGLGALGSLAPLQYLGLL
jgi:hypothetical protein